MSTHHLAVEEHAGAPADHDDFGGLHRDLAATRQAVAGLTAKRFSRRHMVRALGVVVPAAVAVGCGDDASPTSPTSSTSSTDAALTGLTLSGGSISPSFSAANTAYTASVDNAVASPTVTAVSSSSTATIKINGTTVATGVPSTAVALALGTTTITVAVTAADNATTRTYTIAVTRSETVASSCTGQQKIPSETGGPYPGDGSNGPNVLVMSGIVRSDIRSSFGGMSRHGSRRPADRQTDDWSRRRRVSRSRATRCTCGTARATADIRSTRPASRIRTICAAIQDADA